MKMNLIKGKRIIAKALAGFMAALMVVSLVPLGTVDNLKTVKAASGTLTPDDILGDSINFGIVAGKLEQTQHMQTNYAVKEFENNGNVNIDPDLITAKTSGENVIIPFYAGSILGDGTARLDNFKADVEDRKQVIFYVGKEYKNKVKVKSPSNVTFYVMPEEKTTIENNVQGMLNNIKNVSNNLYNRRADIVINSESTLETQDQNHYGINIADEQPYKDMNLVVISVADDASVFWAAMAAGGLEIKKKSNQTILFNIAKQNLELNRYSIWVEGTTYSAYSDKYVQTQSPIELAGKNEFLRDEVMGKVIWNMPNATDVSVRETCGLFLATRDNVKVTLNSTSSGWMVANGTFHQESGEWHFPHETVETFDDDVQGDLTIIVYKEYKDSNGNPANAPETQAKFQLYFDEQGQQPVTEKYINEHQTTPGSPLAETAVAGPFNGKNAAFFPFNLPSTNGTSTYYIKEIEGGTGYPVSDAVVKVTIKWEQTGAVVEYEKKKGDNTVCEVPSGGYPTFINKQTSSSPTNSIILGKRIENADGSSVQWNDVKDNIEFKVYDITGKEAQNYLTDGRLVRTIPGEDGKLLDKNGNRTYDVTIKNLEHDHTYLVVETKNGLNGDNKIGSIEYTVNTTANPGTCTEIGGLSTVELKLDSDKTVTFTNEYKKKDVGVPKGKLTIKKEIKAPAGETAPSWEDIRGNIKFEISGPGYNETISGTDSRFSGQICLIEGLEPGEYTIKEIAPYGLESYIGDKQNGEITKDGVAKKYHVEVTASPAAEKVRVASNGNPTKTFTNTYSSREPAKLTITKKIASTDGSSISWDDIKSNIEFKVVSADESKSAIIKEEDGVVEFTGSGDTYSYTWKVPGDFPMGSYIVTETGKGLGPDDKINGEKYIVTTSGDSGTPGKHVVSISYDHNTPVAFTNTYTKQKENKGSITINKIVETPNGQSSVPSWNGFNKDVEFTIEGKDASDNTVYTKTIKGTELENQSKTIYDLDKSLTYTITETKNGLVGNKIGNVEYTVKTEYAVNGGAKANSATVDFNTNANATVDVTNTYTRIRPESIYISKKEIGGSNELPNAQMALYEGDDTTGTLVESWTTKGTGNHMISGDKLNKNTKYTLVEKIAPTGHILATNIVFEIGNDGKISPLGTYLNNEFGNSADDKGRIITMFDGVITDVQLEKKFEGSISQSLAKTAVFGLYTDAACTQLKDQKSPEVSGGSYIVKFSGKNLTVGAVYYIKEIKAPAGYKLSNAKYSCTIDANGSVVYACIENDNELQNTNTVCYNVKDSSSTTGRTGSITLTGINKVVDKTGNGAPDESFYYEVKEGNVVKLTGIVPNEGDIIFGTIEYTESDIGKHTYTVTEKKGTTDGMTYDVGSKTITVTVDKDVRNNQKLITSVSGNNSSTVFTFNNVYTGPGTTPPPVTPTTTGNNSTVGGSTTNSSATVMDPILVRKVFLDGKVGTYNMERSGCYFTLYTDPSCKPEYAIADAKEVEAVWSTSENQWMLYIRSLIVPVGNVYYLKEVKAPTGYKINDTVWDCIVGSNGKVTYRDHATGTGVNSVICQNVKKKQTGGSTEKAPKTGDPVNATLPIGVVTLLGLASVFCFMKAGRKRRKAERRK